MIEIYYRDRDDPDSMARAIAACQQQIDLAPAAAKAFRRTYNDRNLPAHKGYEQLAIIYDNTGRISDALNICMQAQTQGWADDWDGRINRYARKGMKADKQQS